MTALLDDRTRLGLTPASWLVLGGAGAALGGGLGLLLDPVTAWAAGQSWLPAHAVVLLLADLADGAPSWAQLVGGLVLGVVAGLFVGTQATVVEVGRDEIVVLEGSRRWRLARSQVGVALVDRGRLSVRDHADVDLLDVKVDGDLEELRRALVAHDWQVRR